MSLIAARFGRPLTLLGGLLLMTHFFLPCYLVLWHEQVPEAGIPVSQNRDLRLASPASTMVNEPVSAALVLPPLVVSGLMLLGSAFPKKLGRSEQLPQALIAVAFAGASMIVLFGAIFTVGGLVMGWLRMEWELLFLVGILLFFVLVTILGWRATRIPLERVTYGRRFLLCHALYILASPPLWEYLILRAAYPSQSILPWFYVAPVGWGLMLVGILIRLRALPTVEVDSTIPWDNR
jgi:hypothetical protein